METTTLEEMPPTAPVVTSARGTLSDGTQVWRYKLSATLSSGTDWNLVILDSHGMMVVNGDNGRFIYQWGSFGPCFRTFLVTCDAEYVLKKLAPTRHYAGEQTVRVVKEHILHCVRAGMLKPSREQPEMQLLREHNDLDRSEDFAQWLVHTKIPDAHALAHSEFDAGARRFVQVSLPRLQAFLRQELVAESTAEPRGA